MHVIPAIILAKSTLDETIAALRRSELVNPINCNRPLGEQISFVIDLNLTKKSIDCLVTSCASRHLTMLVIDPHTQLRHAVPSEYFDQRPLADLEFDSAFFRATELSEQVVADPLYKLVCPYRGWVHGFVESEFRVWLGNAEIGPLAGPQMRPFFHAGLTAPADLELDEVVAEAPDGIADAAPPRILNEEKRRGALLKWAKTEYGEDLAQIVGRDVLLALGRKHVASNVNSDDVRWLRRQAPKHVRVGGRPRER